MKLKSFIGTLCASTLITAASAAPIKNVGEVSLETEFLFVNVCSGIKTNSSETATIATAYCIGRIRGFAESHQLTSNMYTTRLKDDLGDVEIPKYQIFCISPETNDRQLYEGVLTWVSQHRAIFDKAIEKYGIGSARTVAFTAGLAQSFPCITV